MPVDPRGSKAATSTRPSGCSHPQLCLLLLALAIALAEPVGAQDAGTSSYISTTIIVVSIIVLVLLIVGFVACIALRRARCASEERAWELAHRIRTTDSGVEVRGVPLDHHIGTEQRLYTDARGNPLPVAELPETSDISTRESRQRRQPHESDSEDKSSLANSSGSGSLCALESCLLYGRAGYLPRLSATTILDAESVQEARVAPTSSIQEPAAAQGYSTLSGATHRGSTEPFAVDPLTPSVFHRPSLDREGGSRSPT